MEFPSEYCYIDGMNALHCVSLQGATFTHHRSEDGGLTWDTMNHSLDGVASSIEEWEFKPALADSSCSTRYRTAGPDVDMLWHVRGVQRARSGHPDLPRTGVGRPRARATTSASISPASASCRTAAWWSPTTTRPGLAVELDLPRPYCDRLIPHRRDVTHAQRVLWPVLLVLVLGLRERENGKDAFPEFELEDGLTNATVSKSMMDGEPVGLHFRRGAVTATPPWTPWTG